VLLLCCSNGRLLQYVIQTWNKISKTGFNEVPVPELLLWWLNIFGLDKCYQVWDLSPRPHRDEEEIIAPSLQLSIQIVQNPFCVYSYVYLHTHTSLCICAHFKVIFCIWILVSDATYDLRAAKRVQFVSDRMSYIVLRGRWCNIIVLNVHASTKEKSGDSKDNFYEELKN